SALQENSRVLAGHWRAEGEGGCEVFLLPEQVQSEDAKYRERGVRSDEHSVGEQVRRKRIQPGSEESGRRAEQVSRPEKSDKEARGGKSNHCGAAPEQQPVGVVAVKKIE